MKEPLLVIGVIAFIAALLFRLFRDIRLGRSLKSRPEALPTCTDAYLDSLKDKSQEMGSAKDVIRELGRRVPGIESAECRAAYHCAAGNIAMTKLVRPKLAVALYLRALREDSSCVPALDKIQEILVGQRRFRRLEWTCWDILGRLSDGDVGGTMWTRCWSALASVYSASPRTVRRADAIRKVVEALQESQIDENEEELK